MGDMQIWEICRYGRYADMGDMQPVSARKLLADLWSGCRCQRERASVTFTPRAGSRKVVEERKVVAESASQQFVTTASTKLPTLSLTSANMVTPALEL